MTDKGAGCAVGSQLQGQEDSEVPVTYRTGAACGTCQPLAFVPGTLCGQAHLVTVPKIIQPETGTRQRWLQGSPTNSLDMSHGIKNELESWSSGSWLAHPAEDPGSVSSGSQPSTAPGDQTPPSGLCGDCTHVVHRQKCRQNIHTHEKSQT